MRNVHLLAKPWKEGGLEKRQSNVHITIMERDGGYHWQTENVADIEKSIT